MPVNYSIQADVVDITSDTPRVSDVFLVDTNVWYWMTYPNATSTFPNQLSDYPSFLNKALAIKSKVCHSGLSLAELTHLIEKTEREIYKQSVANIKTKEYRHNLPTERIKVISEVQAAWSQVKSLAEPLAAIIDEPTTDAALVRFQTDKVDGYDLFIIESMKRHGLVQIITDDGDFSTLPDIKVFTANRNVINAARNQGKLFSR